MKSLGCGWTVVIVGFGLGLPGCLEPMNGAQGALEMQDTLTLDAGVPPATDGGLRGVDVPVVLPPPQAYSACDFSTDPVELLWFNNHIPSLGFGQDSRYRFFGFSEHPGLLATGPGPFSQQGAFHYALSGNLAFPSPFLVRNGVDRGWNLRLDFPHPGTVEVRWVVTDALLFQVPQTPHPMGPDIVAGQVVASLSASGDRVILLTCWNGVDDATLTSFELPGGEAGPTATLSNFACSGFPRRPLMEPAASGDSVVVMGATGGDIFHVDLGTGETHHVDTLGGGDPGESQELGFWFTGPTVFDVAIHPDGDVLATMTSEGLIRFWTLPTLDPTLEPLAGRVEPINQNTYMPDGIAPLAWSPDGHSLVHVDPDGAIVFQNVATQEVTLSLARPASVDGNQPGFGEAPVTQFGEASVTQFAFSVDGSLMAMKTSSGTALFGCQDMDITGDGETLDVLLDGPAAGEVGAELTFVATHINGTDVHGHQFFVNEVAMTSMSMDRQWVWTPEKAGTFEVTVLIDDGYNVGETMVTVEVK